MKITVNVKWECGAITTEDYRAKAVARRTCEIMRTSNAVVDAWVEVDGNREHDPFNHRSK